MFEGSLRLSYPCIELHFGRFARPTNPQLASMNIGKIWKSLVPGLCGTATHSCVMFLKSWTGFLPSFHPYEDLQRTLGALVGGSVHPVVPWALSFLNGIVVLGFLFGRIYRPLPGRHGAVKGFVFGVFGWILMGLFYYPALGLGPFAAHAGLGWRTARPLFAAHGAELQRCRWHRLFRAQSERSGRAGLRSCGRSAAKSAVDRASRDPTDPLLTVGVIVMCAGEYGPLLVRIVSFHCCFGRLRLGAGQDPSLFARDRPAGLIPSGLLTGCCMLRIVETGNRETFDRRAGN